MIKSELISGLAREMGIALTDAEEGVRIFFDELVGSLVKGERIEIRGFGAFSVRDYKAYSGRNPRTGELIEVKPKGLPFFKVGKDLYDRLNPEVEA